ncbi:MAG: DNA integrity scanning protein DisA [Candidatus Hydrogenedentes bacterium]|nr:DNA integrity scanning protein DisA [Candidatus Hydrogenedentota bacterium]
MSRPKRKTSEEALRDALTMISPGTKLREAIASVLQSGNGALICLGDSRRLDDISEGGVEVNAPLTPQLLYELTKMDGAIIVTGDASRILAANRFLKPDAGIPSKETGTRHRAAERTARQAKCMVITISEERARVTLYVNELKHQLDSLPTLLNKATQAIQALEKYTNVLKQSMQELSAREFQDMVTIFDVCQAIQRCEMVVRIAREIDPYLLELGVEGRLINLQLQELILPVEEAQLVIKDYYRAKPGTTYEQVLEKIRGFSQQELLDLSDISQALGYGPNPRSVDTYLTPRGYRILTLTQRLTPQVIENLIARFDSLQAIMRASKDELQDVDGVGDVLAERVRSSLNLLRSQVVMDRGAR